MQPNEQSTDWTQAQAQAKPKWVFRTEQNKKINPEKLADELTDALGAGFGGLGTGREIVVTLTESAVETDKDLTESIVANHDAAGESRGQATRREAREALERLINPTKAIDVEDLRRVVVQLATEGAVRRD